MMYSEEDETDDDDDSQSCDSKVDAALQKKRSHSLKSKQQVMSIFKKFPATDNDEATSYTTTIPKAKAKLFNLAIRYVSCGASFRMTANIIDETYEVLASPCLRSCTPSMVSSFVRVVCAVNLQRISDLLKYCWAFSLALDSAAHQNTAYLDVRIRVYVTRLQSIVKLHVWALPFHELHTGEAMFRMVV
jgi:hypothetical protein